MAEYTSKYGQYDLQVYANCDILFNYRLVDAISSARKLFPEFLLIGERLDLEPGVSVDVDTEGWFDSLPELLRTGGLRNRCGSHAMDYFGFIRNMWKELPPVFMGRALCDQALLHYCFCNAIPVVDGSRFIAAIHQYHDYSHIGRGKEEVYWGRDRSIMAKAHGLRHSLPVVSDGQWYVDARGTIRVSHRAAPLRRLELELRYKYKLARFSLLLRVMQYWRGRKGVAPPQLSYNDVMGVLQDVV
jgi:hypothetical protein